MQRGLAHPHAARRFLRPAFEYLHDPLAMRDMAPAVERIARAIRDKERILIYGDYDVDGTTSVVLLTKAIELAGGIAVYHVPHRLKDGYGMRSEVVEAAREQGVKVIVSVDTGIRAAEVVRRANQLGIDVIVTDHHLPESELPPACMLNQPSRLRCPEKVWRRGRNLQADSALLPHLGWPAIGAARQRSFLKMAAIATVADVVSLTGENHSSCRRAAWVGRGTQSGLRALLDVADFSAESVPSARQVAFQIAPPHERRGSHGHREGRGGLFLTNDAERAKDLAQQLRSQYRAPPGRRKSANSANRSLWRTANARSCTLPRTGIAACSGCGENRLVEPSGGVRSQPQCGRWHGLGLRTQHSAFHLLEALSR